MGTPKKIIASLGLEAALRRLDAAHMRQLTADQANSLTKRRNSRPLSGRQSHKRG